MAGRPITWTDERIQEGLNRFFEENGRFPTALEYDACPYLPTARQIQRRFVGGLPEFRAKFLPSEVQDYTKGEVRSGVARLTKERSYTYEEEFYRFLTGIFSELFIHEQKRLRPGNVACDFFVYTSMDTGLAIDLFYAMDLNSLARIVNIKLKRYTRLPIGQKIYFVSMTNPQITQTAIDAVMRNRKVPIPENIKVLTEEDFKRELLKALTYSELKSLLAK